MKEKTKQFLQRMKHRNPKAAASVAKRFGADLGDITAMTTEPMATIRSDPPTSGPVADDPTVHTEADFQAAVARHRARLGSTDTATENGQQAPAVSDGVVNDETQFQDAVRRMRQKRAAAH